eukprot:TRINITY_DN8720_c0_g1_i1.p1 TRINITY_DN8720_c0_g1~~TRINITY_DN8720_c0_g1_i1.p1  ORF type:complete len:524 (+),score=90.74 TRINITY_DN8720_c0_g1_i1:228-1799(+)
MTHVRVPRDEEAQAMALPFSSGSSDEADIEALDGGRSVNRSRRRILGGVVCAIGGAAAIVAVHASGMMNSSRTPAAESPARVQQTAEKTVSLPAVSAVGTVQADAAAAAMPVVAAPPAPVVQATPAVQSPVAAMAQNGNVAVRSGAMLDPSTLTAIKGSNAVENSNPSNPSSLIPSEDKSDGNKCDTSEEEFEGLCYKTCSSLTNGEYAYRYNAFACCKSADCSITDIGDMKVTAPIPCSGNDVSGDGSSCPHTAGVCLKDEELDMGECYKKCSALTNGKFPYRIAAATCCKSSSPASCMNPFNDDTSASFDVGGGKGDGDATTPAGAHAPLKQLAESPGSTAKAKTAAEKYTPKASEIIPKEIAHDHNPCDSLKEEPFGGLCYDKCSILTHGKYPFRSTPWHCCHEKSCALNPLGLKSDGLTPCDGYDVSGDGKSCPHPPGDCLNDEELLLGACYMKCSLLTNGEYPHREAPATCCKVKGVGCMNPANLKTSSDFDVGGGKGDGNPDTPSSAHEPSQALTSS